MKKVYFAGMLGVSIAAFAILSAARMETIASAASNEMPALMDVIHGADGKPMNGVAITAQSTEQTFKTTVYSDEKGEYVFPHLLAGSYRVWAQAVGFATDRAEVKLDGSHTSAHNFMVKPVSNFEAELTGGEWFAALPEDTAAHKRDKQILYVACTGCHGIDVILNNRFDEAGWKAIVHSMESADYRGWRGVDDMPTINLGWEGSTIRHHEAELASYLAEMRGPDKSPMVLKPFPRPTGDAARAVVTQYDLPIQARPSELAPYTGDDWEKGESTGMHGMVGIHDVVADDQGMAWITQSRENFETNRSMVKLDPTTGKMTLVNVLGPTGNRINFEQVGPTATGDLIWMHAGGGFVKLEGKTDTFTMYPMPRVYGGTQNSIDPDLHGHIFANGKYGTVELDPSELDRKGAMYPGWDLWQQLTVGNGTTYGIGADSEDNPWWSEAYSDIVATRNMKTGETTALLMRDPGYDARKSPFTPDDIAFYDSIGSETWGTTAGDPNPWSEMPRRLSTDKNGDTVWVPLWAQTSIAEINIHTFKVTYHELPLEMHPYKTVVDKNHNVFTDTQVGDGMFRYTPSTNQWTYFQLPTHGCSSRHMSFDDNKNEAWVPCDQADTVDRIQFRTAAQIQALKAAAVPAQ